MCILIHQPVLLYQPEVAIARVYLCDISEGEKCKIGNSMQRSLKGTE
jgi:hypothetical protein